MDGKPSVSPLRWAVGGFQDSLFAVSLDGIRRCWREEPPRTSPKLRKKHWSCCGSRGLIHGVAHSSDANPRLDHLGEGVWWSKILNTLWPWCHHCWCVQVAPTGVSRNYRQLKLKNPHTHTEWFKRCSTVNIKSPKVTSFFFFCSFLLF